MTTSRKGTCHDDMVALNADDGCDGPIGDIEIDGDIDIDTLSFDNLSRREDPSARETFGIGAHAHIENLALSHIFQRGAPGMAPVLLRNAGRIDRLSLYDIDAGGATVLENAGLIGRLREVDVRPDV